MTNKEHILALRGAYLDGRAVANGWLSYLAATKEKNFTCHNWEKTAKEKYPLPKITKPRVLRVGIGPYELRINNGTIETRNSGSDWRCFANEQWLPVIKDLIANPTEEVEDDS